MPEANENATQGAPAEGKAFTQAQVDAIIGDRLARERAKHAIRQYFKRMQIRLKPMKSFPPETEIME